MCVCVLYVHRSTHAQNDFDAYKNGGTRCQETIIDSAKHVLLNRQGRKMHEVGCQQRKLRLSDARASAGRALAAIDACCHVQQLIKHFLARVVRLAEQKQQDLCARALQKHTHMPAGMRMAEIVVHTRGSSELFGTRDTRGSSELFSTRVIRADCTMH